VNFAALRCGGRDTRRGTPNAFSFHSVFHGGPRPSIRWGYPESSDGRTRCDPPARLRRSPSCFGALVPRAITWYSAPGNSSRSGRAIHNPRYLKT
jgi:hypothetical protein